MKARPRLLEQVRNQLRTLHHSYRTEQQYLFWVRRFILLHDKRHPIDRSAAEIEAFLTHRAVDREVSASTQDQALAALLFLYQKVLQAELPWRDGIVRAKRPRYLPVVLTPGEVKGILSHLQAEYWLIGSLLYGAGLRVREALTLRVKDVQFEYRQRIVRSGKGSRDRSAILPDTLLAPLQQHLVSVKARHEFAIRSGFAGVVPHLSAQLRDAPAGAWLRHPHRAGATGAQGRRDHADLQARHAQRRRSAAGSSRRVGEQHGRDNDARGRTGQGGDERTRSGTSGRRSCSVSRARGVV